MIMKVFQSILISKTN